MINIFEVFLPQLLRYPNPNDPLNGEAAALMMRHPKEYEAKVKGRQQWLVIIHGCHSHILSEYVQRYATKEALDPKTEDNEDDEEDEEMSDVGSIDEDES